MPRCPEAEDLCEVGPDAFGREVLLTPDAAKAWFAMKSAAEGDGTRLLLLSGFRSLERQAGILKRKLAAGETLEQILRVNTYPGFSEHHTGRAVDLGSHDCEHLSEVFETTNEFRWLLSRANGFGFSLSYPRSNGFGIAYEPWHWCWQAGNAIR
jgi:D-alanyl-D-alanine carboxypeptidase